MLVPRLFFFRGFDLGGFLDPRLWMDMGAVGKLNCCGELGGKVGAEHSSVGMESNRQR
jgi:hypothetical protein